MQCVNGAVASGVDVNSNSSVKAAKGPGRCKIDNGGCWQDTREGVTQSACQVWFHPFPPPAICHCGVISAFAEISNSNGTITGKLFTGGTNCSKEESLLIMKATLFS